MNRVLFDNVIRAYGDDTENLVATFNIAYPLVLSISVLTIAVILIILLACVHTAVRIRKIRNRSTEGKKDNNKYRKLSQKFKAAIISIAIIIALRLTMIIALDFAALYFTFCPSKVEIKEIHCTGDSKNNSLYYAPFSLLAADLLAAAIYCGIIAYTLTKMICPKKPQYCKGSSGSQANTAAFQSDNGYYTLAMTLLCILASILVHLPYVAIAYLNDTNYAGSVFIFFTVATFLEFIILELIFISWFKFNTKVIPDVIDGSPLPTELPLKQDYYLYMFCCKCSKICVAIAIILSLSLLYLMLSMSVCFFFYLPINHSISNPPNQIIVIYQTGLVFAGALVTYKTIFKRSNPLVRALKKSTVKKSLPKEIELEAISNRKKLANFYSFIITDVVLKLPRVESQPNTPETPVSPQL